MTNKELLDKIRNEILHLKMKELQRTNGINTGADVYLSSYAVLSILSNALTEESEDERIRKWLVDYFSSIKATVWIHRDITCEQILEWLEKQKEQKPAWSEEDRHAIENCEYAIKETFKDEQNPHRIGTLDWLKSLRPSWKPSEEHLSALLAVFNDPNNIGSQTCQLALTDLYEQLKKL